MYVAITLFLGHDNKEEKSVSNQCRHNYCRPNYTVCILAAQMVEYLTVTAVGTEGQSFHVYNWNTRSLFWVMQ